MKEKELKILDINPISLIPQLEELGARKIFAGKISDQYYDFPTKNLKTHGYSLRIRTINGQTHQLCFKEKIKDKRVKIRQEHEFDLPSQKQGELFVTWFGLFPCFFKEKMRLSYMIDDVKFDIDFYEGLKPMLEIEAPKKKLIFAWIEKLGLQDHVTSRKGARALFKHYA